MLAEKARNGTLDVMDASGGTFTVTNLGGLGIHAFTPIINQPEVGILGIGRMRETPTLSRGMVLNHYTMWLSLTFDHRAVDGAPAARFLNAVAGRLEDLSWLIP